MDTSAYTQYLAISGRSTFHLEKIDPEVLLALVEDILTSAEQSNVPELFRPLAHYMSGSRVMEHVTVGRGMTIFPTSVGVNTSVLVAAIGHIKFQSGVSLSDEVAPFKVLVRPRKERGCPRRWILWELGVQKIHRSGALEGRRAVASKMDWLQETALLRVLKSDPSIAISIIDSVLMCSERAVTTMSSEILSMNRLHLRAQDILAKFR